MKMNILTIVYILSLTLIFHGMFVVAEGDESECTHGKLYISSRNSTIVHIYDLNGSLESMYNERNVSVPMAGGPEIVLDVTSSGLAVAAIYRGTVANSYQDGTVSWINTAFFREDHGDHFHLEYGTPTLIPNAAFQCARPIHFTKHDGKIGIFCDGRYDIEPQVNTTVWIIDESKMGTSSSSAVIFNTTLQGSHHGVVIPVDDDHVLYSLAAPDRVNRTTNGTLYATPWTFQITDYNGNIIHSISDTTDKDLYCSGYHGTAALDNTFAMACDANHGGILMIEYNDDSESYNSRALLYPSSYINHRTGTFYEHHKSPYAIGNFASNNQSHLLAFKYTDTTLSSTNVKTLPVRQCGFQFEQADGEIILNFMPDGKLYAYNISSAGGWVDVAQVQVVPGMTSCTQASFVPGYLQAFIVYFPTNTLYSVKLDKVKNGIMTVGTTTLPYTANSMVVAGAPEEYACSLNERDIITNAPSVAPSIAPATTEAPTPTKSTSCGLFGLSFFCPMPGRCGFFKRLMNLGSC